MSERENDLKAKVWDEAVKLTKSKILHYQRRARCAYGLQGDALRVIAQAMYYLRRDFKSKAKALRREGKQ